MNEVHGQHVGKQERTEEYAHWSGATPVGEKRADLTSEMVQKVAADAVATVRAALAVGCKKVVWDCQDPAIVGAIRALLTEEERPRVSFGSDSPV